jgi:hypothetical protein
VARDLSCGDLRIYLEMLVRRVECRSCGKVKRERLAWLADNPFYTKRFAFFVGRRCRAATIKDVARELNLDWHSVKELEKQYMREQLRRLGTPGPKVIGVDEVSIRNPRTKCHWALWKGSTTKSAYSSAELMGCAMKNISASKSLPACYPQYDRTDNKRQSNEPSTAGRRERWLEARLPARSISLLSQNH